jgi:quercetin dioxygenase-like cupin family protein
MMCEGDVLVMPPGDVHSFFGMGDALVLEISKPCILSDNIFEDARIAAWLTATGS